MLGCANLCQVHWSQQKERPSTLESIYNVLSLLLLHGFEVDAPISEPPSWGRCIYRF
jgi:hypothetical protein